MTLVTKKRINPLDELEFSEEPFEVKDRFAIYIPKHRNHLLEILQKHIEKQKLQAETTNTARKSEEGGTGGKNGQERPATSDSAFFSSRSSRLREKLNNQVNEARKATEAEPNINTVTPQKETSGTQQPEVGKTEQPNASKPQQTLSVQEPKVENVSGNQQQSPIIVIQSNEQPNTNTQKPELPTIMTAGNQLPATTQPNPVTTKQEGTVELQVPAQENLEAKKELEATAKTAETADTQKETLDAEITAQTAVKTKPDEALPQDRKDTESKKASLRGTHTKFSSPDTKLFSPDVRNRTATSFGFRISTGSLSSRHKSQKITLQEALTERTATADDGPGRTVYGTMSNITPKMIKKTRHRPFNTLTENNIRSMNPASPALTKQMQYDYGTRSYVGALLKQNITDDIGRYEDQILRSQELLGGLLKLKDMRLLTQNPVLIRKYRGCDKFNFIEASHHTKNTGPGYARNDFGGFFFKN